MTTVTKDMTINELLQIDRRIAGLLMQAGMHCVGCPSAQAETIEEAGMVHNMNVEELIQNINDFLAAE